MLVAALQGLIAMNTYLCGPGGERVCIDEAARFIPTDAEHGRSKPLVKSKAAKAAKAAAKAKGGVQAQSRGKPGADAASEGAGSSQSKEAAPGGAEGGSGGGGAHGWAPCRDVGRGLGAERPRYGLEVEVFALPSAFATLGLPESTDAAAQLAALESG